MFEVPGEVVRDVDGAAAEGDDGLDVGAEGVADHDEVVDVDIVAGEHAGVGGFVFLSHDLHGVEVVGQAGGGDLGFLVPEVALGDEHEAVAGFELVDGLGHAVE